ILGLGPAEEFLLALPCGMRDVESVALGFVRCAAQKAELDEARHLMEARIPRPPHCLEFLFHSCNDLETVHRKKHQHLLKTWSRINSPVLASGEAQCPTGSACSAAVRQGLRSYSRLAPRRKRPAPCAAPRSGCIRSPDGSLCHPRRIRPWRSSLPRSGHRSTGESAWHARPAGRRRRGQEPSPRNRPAPEARES